MPSEERVNLSGALDYSTEPLVRSLLGDAIGGDASEVVVDCRDVTFIDSSGLRVLVAAQEALTRRGSHLRVDHASRSMRRVIEITGLDTYLGVVSSGPD